MQKTENPRKGRLSLPFEISLLLKGFFALLETFAGLIVYFSTVAGNIFSNYFSEGWLLNFVKMITGGELAEDPRDFAANYLLRLAEHISIAPLKFTAFYLLGHGIVKLFLIIGLWRKKLWYYPLAIVVFALFIIYQLYRFSFTHSLFLIFISAIDIIVVGLTWQEYKYLRSRVN